MNFETAIALVPLGYKIRRRSWIHDIEVCQSNGKVVIKVWVKTNKISVEFPWLPNAQDIRATDWEIHTPEATHPPPEIFTCLDAIELARNRGYSVARKAWDGKYKVFYVEHLTALMRAVISEGKASIWQADNEDVYGKDWFVVEEVRK